MKEDIRKSAVAGSWYPGDEKELRKLITDYLDNSKLLDIQGDILAIISPHAGYAYSGPIAASAYKQVMGNDYDAVIILAPSHRESFKGVSIYARGGYETPLGVVPVNEKVADAIIKADNFIVSSDAGHRDEHSLEIQLPFLQVALPKASIVPVSIWDYSFSNCKRLADAISKAVKEKKVLLIASTDLYHGYSYDDCRKMDKKTIDKIIELKPEAFCEGIINQKFMACGGGPVVVAELVALKLGADKAKVIKKTNSSEITGDRDGYVVGYASIAVYKERTGKEAQVGVELGLNEDDKKTLLKIARESIEYGLQHKTAPAITVKSAILNENRGAFVTLTKNNTLRGCIGYITAAKPLAETVQEMAAAAAFRDPRFSPLKKNEFDKLEIEISVLTPLKVVNNIEEIKVGKHGIIIEKGGRSGLLLPQVATEYGWDRTTFLEHTCKKAGLASVAWKDPGTVIKIFSADIFHEK